MADLEQVVNDLNLASQSLQELREKYDGALDLLDNKNTEITGALDSAKSDALQEIQTISDTATSQISQLKDTSLNLVNEAKNTAIEEVNNAVSRIDTSKEEALLEIEQAKVAQEEKITALEQAKENIITELSEKARLLTQNLEWTVGTGGKFDDLNSAIIEANNYYSADLDITITLKIISNITIDNRVAIFRGGCRVIVTCENPSVVITVNKNSTNAYNYTFAGFGFEFKSVNINVVGASTDAHNGSLFSFGDFKIYDLKVTGSPCMIIHNNGSSDNNEYFRTNAAILNIVVEYSSRMTQALVYLGNNGSLYIGGTKENNRISNAGTGFVSRGGSNITLLSGITCNNIGTLFQVQWGGIISINAPSSNIILNGAIKTSQPSLTPTKHGLIFDDQN